MKRILIFAASVLMLVFACVGLAACGEHTHKFGEYVYNNDATCTQDGTETATCECGETDTRVKEGTALGHEFGEYTSDGNATCTEDGTETAKCIRCNVTDTRTLAALGHSLTKHDGTATCTEYGTVPYYECERCEKKFKDKKATAEETDLTPRVLGHEFTVENACIRFNDCGVQWEYTDGLEFKLNDEGGYTVTGPGKRSGGPIALKIPYGYKGKYVTEIGDDALRADDTAGIARSVEFPETITKIGSHAFYSIMNLKGDLKLPKNLIYIGEGAFQGCYNMDGTLEMPDGIMYIGTNAFSGTKLSVGADYKLPSGITKYEPHAFAGLKMEGELVIPDCVTEIGDYAFGGKEVTSLKLGKNLKKIGAGAFNSCEFITSVEIPDGVTSIGSAAFRGCSQLATVTIPDSVIRVGQNAFDSTKFYNDPENWVGGVALYAGQNLLKVKETAAGDFTVREGTKSITENAFIACKQITSMKLPEGLLTIGTYAFSACTSLGQINIPSTVVSIGTYAFYMCQALSSVEFGDPNGWVVSKTSKTEGATEVTGLNDAHNAVGYFLTEYLVYNWFKL